MTPPDDIAAVEAALAILNENGFDIASPRDGDLDDLEQERFNAVANACRAYLSAAQEGREAAGRGPEKVEGGYLYKWVDADGEPHQFVHPSPYLVAATPAPAQPAARVVVKGLEWVEQAGNWIANVGFGTYWVDYDNGRWEWGFRLKFSPGNSTAVASEIEAKAAAQADYEKRISPHLASPTDADAVAPEGYALVPIKPTEAMISEGDRVMYGRYGCSFEVAPIYEAMLTAAKAGEDG